MCTNIDPDDLKSRLDTLIHKALTLHKQKSAGTHHDAVMEIRSSGKHKWHNSHPTDTDAPPRTNNKYTTFTPLHPLATIATLIDNIHVEFGGLALDSALASRWEPAAAPTSPSSTD